MSDLQFIITADDYGVSPIIDQGIEKAIEEGLVTSVAAFANGESDLVTKSEHANVKCKAPKVKKLFKEYGHLVDIGLHFTITSGFRIRKDAKSLSPKKKKKRRRRFNSKLIQPFVSKEKDIEKELRAQVKVFEDCKIPIAHFSDHHGVLTHTEQGHKALIRVVKDYNKKHGRKVPIRNPVYISQLIPQEHHCLNTSVIDKKAKTGKIVSWLIDMVHPIPPVYILLKEQKRIMRAILEAGIPTTNYYVESFYGEPTLQKLQCMLNRKNYDCKRPYQKELFELEGTIDDDVRTAEINVHIAIPPEEYKPEEEGVSAAEEYTSELDYLEDYPGVDHKYTRKERLRELDVLRKHLKNVIISSESVIRRFVKIDDRPV